jgi:hypothetical protein
MTAPWQIGQRSPGNIERAKWQEQPHRREIPKSAGSGRLSSRHVTVRIGIQLADRESDRPSSITGVAGVVDRKATIRTNTFDPTWRTQSRTSILMLFLASPARKPRTVCDAQPIASAICAVAFVSEQEWLEP